ncbi:MAG: hypothetical protein R2867_37820 [Caldilineaceae bacterium]
MTLESPLKLALQRDAQTYQPGTNAIFTATLVNGTVPVPGATVSATLNLPDTGMASITFSEQMNGTYVAQYTVPKQAGGVVMTVIAQGSLPSSAASEQGFSRQSEVVWSISPAAVAIKGTVTDSTLDRNADSLADELVVNVPLSVTIPATYTLHASLTSSDTVIAGAVTILTAPTAGLYWVALHFAGTEIGAAGIDGPYSVRNVVLLNPALGNVPILDVALLHTTAAYRADEFAQPPQSAVFLPLVLR